jgi:lysozyme family protein
MNVSRLLGITSIFEGGRRMEFVKFDEAVEYVLGWEGGLVEDAADSGGITNFGISLRFLRGLDEEMLRKYGVYVPPDADAVREMTLEQARNIYFGEFWVGSGIERLREQEVANYVFDMMVNMGIAQAVKLLQRACWALTYNLGCVKDDGVLGEMTISLANAFAPHEMIPVLMGIRAEFYRSLDKVAFLNGWLRRTYRV